MTMKKPWLIVALLIVAGPASANDLFTAPKPSDVPALIEALADRNLQYGAAIALSKVGKPAVASLADALKNESPTLRRWATYALGRIGRDAVAAVPELMRGLKDRDATLRAVTAETLGKIGPAAKPAVRALAETLKDKNQRTRIRSAVALGSIGPDAQAAVPDLIQAIRDETVRQTAVAALEKIGKPAVPGLVEALEDDHLRLDAAAALRKIDPAAAAKAEVKKPGRADVPALVLALRNTTKATDARRSAAGVLGDLRAQRAVAPLIETLGEADLSEAAASALGKIGKPAVDDLLEALKSENERVRQFSARALGQVGPDAEEAIPALVELLKDRSREVRAAAGKALEGIGPDAQTAVPALIAVLESGDAEPVRQAAIKAMLKAEPSAKPVIVVALTAAFKKTKDNYGVRMLAGMTLKKIDPKAAAKAGVR